MFFVILHTCTFINTLYLILQLYWNGKELFTRNQWKKADNFYHQRGTCHFPPLQAKTLRTQRAYLSQSLFWMKFITLVYCRTLKNLWSNRMDVKKKMETILIVILPLWFVMMTFLLFFQRLVQTTFWSTSLTVLSYWWTFCWPGNHIVFFISTYLSPIRSFSFCSVLFTR